MPELKYTRSAQYPKSDKTLDVVVEEEEEVEAEAEEEAEDAAEEEAEVEDAEAEDRTREGSSQTRNGPKSWNASASEIKRHRKKYSKHAVDKAQPPRTRATKTMKIPALPAQQAV